MITSTTSPEGSDYNGLHLNEERKKVDEHAGNGLRPYPGLRLTEFNTTKGEDGLSFDPVPLTQLSLVPQRYWAMRSCFSCILARFGEEKVTSQ